MFLAIINTGMSGTVASAQPERPGSVQSLALHQGFACSLGRPGWASRHRSTWLLSCSRGPLQWDRVVLDPHPTWVLL